MNTTGNKYLDDVSDATSDIDDDYNVHEVVKYGTYLEVKEVIAKDRPRLIALKDSVSFPLLQRKTCKLIYFIAWTNSFTLCCSF